MIRLYLATMLEQGIQSLKQPTIKMILQEIGLKPIRFTMEVLQKASIMLLIMLMLETL